MSQNSRVPLLLFISTLAIIALHLYGAYDDSIATWGFNHLAVLPVWGMYTTVGIALFFSIFVWIGDGGFLTKFSERISLSENKSTKHFAIGIIWVMVAVVLYLLRSHALAYGDGYAVLAHFTGDFDSLFAGQMKLQIGSILALRLFYQSVTLVLDVTPLEVFSVYSCIGGAVGLAAMYRLTNMMVARNAVPTIFVCVLTSSSVLLFVGHIEHYTWALALGLWSLYFAVLSLEGAKRNTVAVLFAAVASAFHAIALPFVLITVVAAVWSCRLRDRMGFAQLVKKIVPVSVVASLLFVMYSEEVLELNVFVPFLELANHKYPVFSWFHISDLLNLIFYVCPLVLLAPFMLLGTASSHAKKSASKQLMGLAALLLFLPVFWIDPTIGAVRDWDLLAGFGIPLGFLVVLSVMRRNSEHMFRLFFVALAVFVIHQIPNIYEKIDGERSTTHLEEMISDDPHYRTDHASGKRNQTWGRLLRRSAELPELSAKYFVRAIEGSPGDYHSWTHLGQMAVEDKNYDSSIVCFKEAVKFSPEKSGAFQRLSVSLYKTGKLQEAYEAISEAKRHDESNPEVAVPKGVIEYALGMYNESFVTFRAAIDDGNIDPIIRIHLGKLHLRSGNLDSAYTHFTWCAQNYPLRTTYYQPFIETLIGLELSEDAKLVMSAWRNTGPPTELYREYIARIKALENKTPED
ncbi:hypothetical protein JYT16_01650 [Gemmatimonas aurantiaca]|nr:hypothetical protein [Gemmatimonas aurantiaca]